MIYKFAGALILSLSGVLCAAHLNRNAEKRVRQISAWISLLRYVKVQIECFALPMGEILARCDREMLLECGFVGELAPRSFEGLLAASVLYDGESESVIRSFCEEFGRGYREEQTRGCDYYLSMLEGRREFLVGKLPAQKKMNATLSICAALAIVLLLL
ncbi:MAG: hypothetical protein J6Q82_01640 [Clostridia bacterium]|nr:hypothetical protein [Clostridia bacterium]